MDRGRSPFSDAPMNQTNYLIFVQCSLGLEGTLLRELAAWGLTGKPQEGGVEVRGAWAELVRIVLMIRTAESVRVRMKSFIAREFGELIDSLKKLPFRAFLAQGTPVEVRVTCHKSRLWHSDAVAERVYTVLREHVGCVVATEADGERTQRVYARLDHDRVQIALDAGGPRMHRRGYRAHVERASLRETLAYAVAEAMLERLDLAGPEITLWDPFCGAGTLLLELAHLRAGRLAGEGRQPTLEHWRGHDAAGFAGHKRACALQAQETAERRSLHGLRLVGSDVSERALEAARGNARAAQLDSIEFKQGDIIEVAQTIPAGAAIVCNPPYGKRLADCDGVRSLIRLTRERPDLRPVVALVGGEAKRMIPQGWARAMDFQNGGLSVSVRVLGGVRGPSSRAT